MWSAKSLANAFAKATLIAVLVALPVAAQPRDALGAGDVIRVTVYQNPDLTTEATVGDTGTITFPLIGEVAVGGLAPADAQARIAQHLASGRFVLKPQVNLSVLRVRSRQVSVLGEVSRPGRYALDDVSSHLTDILAQAGGITAAGDATVVVMQNRDGKTRRELVDVAGMYRNGDLSNNVRLENGDVVYVERAAQFYVSGEVQRAGAYRLEPDMTVMQAVSVGGGLTPRGTLRGLQIHRRDADGRVHLVAAKPSDRVRADDVIVVHASLF
jgi:polysaccharide biosynthesis/export protein